MIDISILNENRILIASLFRLLWFLLVIMDVLISINKYYSVFVKMYIARSTFDHLYVLN